eukprot:15480468-Alexandrium_andersonii.AAC.1
MQRKGPAIGIIYDGLVRRQWSDWSIAGYRQFELGAAATNIDWNKVGLAESTLAERQAASSRSGAGGYGGAGAAYGMGGGQYGRGQHGGRSEGQHESGGEGRDYGRGRSRDRA